MINETDGHFQPRCASEGGWHLSRYNISAKHPENKGFIIVNLMKGTCITLDLPDMIPLNALDTLSEDSPVLERYKKAGLIVNFDERAMLEALARGACAYPAGVGLTICPTMGCNFDCPYCFENHKAGKMSAEVQDDVVALAERLLDASGAKKLHVTWFGGEPLLAPDVIGSLSERLIKLSADKGVEYYAGIITNGYLLDQEKADMLSRVKVNSYQVTLDGIGPAHDATRHLAGGGPTFERITDNLRTVKISGRVGIRHNVHEANKDEIEQLKAFVQSIAEESGNNIKYYPALVSGNDASHERQSNVNLLCGSDSVDVGILQDLKKFGPGRGNYCMAHNLWSIGIDEKGRLQKCWEDVDKPEHSFGHAKRWDLKNPLGTADDPDKLTVYLNSAGALYDPECRECIWLPECRGGCPNKRVYDKRQCVPYKNDPEAFALAVWQEKKGKE